MQKSNQISEKSKRMTFKFSSTLTDLVKRNLFISILQ